MALGRTVPLGYFPSSAFSPRVHDALHVGHFLNAGEEDRFFAVVVALHRTVPSETVTNEVRVGLESPH